MPAAPPPPSPAPPWRVHLVLFVVQLVFGGFHVVAKGVLETVSPLGLAGLRVAGATPILVWLAWRHDRVLPGRRELPMLALLGLLGVTANQLLFIFGLERTTATHAAILMPSIPVFAVAVGAVAGIERVGPRRLAGVALSVAGALVVLDPRGFALAAGTTLGNLLILLNCLAFAGFLVLQRPVLERLPWRTVIAWAFVFGGGFVAVVAAPALARLPYTEIPSEVWLGVAYIVLLPTALGYAWNTWAVRRSSASTVAAYTTLQPLFAAALAAAFLGERLGWREGLGFALIAGGLWVASRRRPAGREEEEA